MPNEWRITRLAGSELAALPRGHERDTWVTWPTRVAALMAAQLAAEMEKASGTPVTIETAILQRVLQTHVREQLTALADLRLSLG